VVVPGGNGTTKRIGRSGYAAAKTTLSPPRTPTKPKQKMNRQDAKHAKKSPEVFLGLFLIPHPYSSQCLVDAEQQFFEIVE
jgi:hypothetical protein